MSPSRREVLKTAGLAAGAAAGAGALTGCSKPEEVKTGPASVKAAEVPVGSAKIIDDSNFVVTQPKAGEYKAFTRLCPHAGCKVSQVEKAEIVCTCHNSRFSVADGTAVSGPAAGAALGKATAKLEGDTVNVSA